VTKTYFRITTLLLALLCATGAASAQTSKKPNSKTTLANRLAETRADLVTASKAYKASLEKLLPFEEDERKKASEEVEIRKQLVVEGVASKRDLEESERRLATAEARLAVTRKQLGEADTMIAEASGESQLAKLSARPGSYQRTAALIRFNGTARWALADIAKVQGFFTSRFKLALPVSAYGQTSVHDHLGFDHRNAVDVAVHPDSAEGQAIMAYLRNVGIPFIAFRAAVRGSATGAHIHVGYPSHRIAK
jgi:hypothetical protein